MNAIELLTKHHRTVERRFDEVGRASPADVQERVDALADELSVLLAMEEKYFYPAAAESPMREKLREEAETHLTLKRQVADLLATQVDDPNFMAKAAVLRGLTSFHFAEEERELYPAVAELLGERRLEKLAARMERLAVELEEEGAPRDELFSQLELAAPVAPSEKKH